MKINFVLQAEDGIRVHCVTGVQTCALPILTGLNIYSQAILRKFKFICSVFKCNLQYEYSFVIKTYNQKARASVVLVKFNQCQPIRSEERRVGKECRAGWCQDDLKIIKIPATDLANELGNVKVANLILLGAFIKKTGILDIGKVIETLPKAFPKHKQHLVEINQKALLKGAELCS